MRIESQAGLHQPVAGDALQHAGSLVVVAVPVVGAAVVGGGNQPQVAAHRRGDGGVLVGDHHQPVGVQAGRGELVGKVALVRQGRDLEPVHLSDGIFGRVGHSDEAQFGGGAVAVIEGVIGRDEVGSIGAVVEGVMDPHLAKAQVERRGSKVHGLYVAGCVVCIFPESFYSTPVHRAGVETVIAVIGSDVVIVVIVGYQGELFVVFVVHRKAVQTDG
ncbi:hypothetical protein DRN50_08925, partial [Thermococci archaeon]